MNKNKILGLATFSLFGLAYLIALISIMVNDLKPLFEAFKNFGDNLEIILIFLLELLVAIGVVVLSVLGILKAVKDDHSKLDQFTTFILLGISGVKLIAFILGIIRQLRLAGNVNLGGREVVYLIFVVIMLAGAIIHMLLKGNKMVNAIAGVVAAVSLLVLVVMDLSGGGSGLAIVFNIFVLLGAVAAGAVYALPLLSK